MAELKKLIESNVKRCSLGASVYKKLKTIQLLTEFRILFLLVILYRLIIVFVFGFNYTDSDQSIMWLGTYDYSHLNFHEPRFYGQDYNSFLEPLFAVPLYKLGFPLHIALPIITSIMAMTPVLLVSNHFFRIGKKNNAIIILLLYVSLPVNYDLITSLPRGFVTGLFVTSFVYYFGLISTNRYRFFYQSFFLIASFSLNPNSIIFSMPLIFYTWLCEGLKNIRFYSQIFLGTIVGFMIHFFIQSFYRINPNYNLFTYDYSFSFFTWLGGLKHLDLFFNDLTPFFSTRGWVILMIFLYLVSYFFVKRKWHLALTSFFSVVIIIATLCLNKVHSGTSSIFFSASRMYLGVPLVFLFLVGHIELKGLRIIKYALLIYCVLNSFNKISKIDSIFENLYPKNNVVSIEKTEIILNECKKLNDLCQKNNVDLVVIVNHYYYDFINYGCPSCEEDFPQTIRPIFERRTWVIEKIMPHIYKNILFIDLTESLGRQKKIVHLKDRGFYLIKENKLKTSELFDNYQLSIRKY